MAHHIKAGGDDQHDAGQRPQIGYGAENKEAEEGRGDDLGIAEGSEAIGRRQGEGAEWR